MHTQHTPVLNGTGTMKQVQACFMINLLCCKAKGHENWHLIYSAFFVYF